MPCWASRPGRTPTSTSRSNETALDRLVGRLRAEGYGILREDLPTAIALRHDDGREVDLHPLSLTPDGGGDQQLPGGRPPWHYGPPTVGHIDSSPVPCNSLDTQFCSHLGYEPDEDDYADMRALAHRSGSSLPAPYDRPWPSALRRTGHE